MQAGDEFLAGMAAEVQGKARDGNAQNIANMFWAFATLGEHTSRAACKLST
jgi:hypothetical protein